MRLWIKAGEKEKRGGGEKVERRWREGGEKGSVLVRAVLV
jgi:hypothetical protein